MCLSECVQVVCFSTFVFLFYVVLELLLNLCTTSIGPQDKNVQVLVESLFVVTKPVFFYFIIVRFTWVACVPMGIARPSNGLQMNHTLLFYVGPVL